MGVGSVITAVVGGTALGLTALTVPFITPALRRFCLPFIPATPQQIAYVTQAVHLCPSNSRFVDIGSGDGRVAMALSREGISCDGIELNAYLVAYSTARSLLTNHNQRSRFYRRNMWKANVDKYNGCIFFGTENEEMMHKLGGKLSECESIKNIIACRHAMPLDNNNWETAHVFGTGLESVWVYQRTDSQSKASTIRHSDQSPNSNQSTA